MLEVLFQMFFLCFLFSAATSPPFGLSEESIGGTGPCAVAMGPSFFHQLLEWKCLFSLIRFYTMNCQTSLHPFIALSPRFSLCVCDWWKDTFSSSVWLLCRLRPDREQSRPNCLKHRVRLDSSGRSKTCFFFCSKDSAPINLLQTALPLQYLSVSRLHPETSKLTFPGWGRDGRCV